MVRRNRMPMTRTTIAEEMAPPSGSTDLVLQEGHYVPNAYQIQLRRNGARLRLDTDYIESGPQMVHLMTPSADGDTYEVRYISAQPQYHQHTQHRGGSDPLHARYIEGVAEVVNARDFGALGDNSTDNTDALQLAIDRALSTGFSEVYLPPGIFHTGTLMDLDQITFRGDGASVTGLFGEDIGIRVDPIVTEGGTDPIATEALETLETRLDNLHVSVKDFGAKGDSSTDDTQAIQNAIDYAIEHGGGILFFPRGRYMISAPLIVPYVAERFTLSLQGVSAESSELRPLNAMDCLMHFSGRWGFIENIGFYGGSWPYSLERLVDHCLKLSDVLEKNITGCKFKYARINGVYLLAEGNNNSLNFNGNCRFEYNGSTYEAGTFSSVNDGDTATVTFSELDLIENKIGRGAYLIYEDDIYELTEVIDANTMTVVPQLPQAEIIDSPYMVRQGAGFYGDQWGDNNLHTFSKVQFIANEAGIIHEGLYGPTVVGCSFEYNYLFGIKLGHYPSTPIATYTTLIDHPYFEMSGYANILVDFAEGLTVIEPLLTETRYNFLSGLDSIRARRYPQYSMMTTSVLYYGQMYHYNQRFSNTDDITLSHYDSREYAIHRYDGSLTDTVVNLPALPTHLFTKEWRLYVENSGGRDIIIKCAETNVNGADGTVGVTLPPGKGYIIDIFGAPGEDTWYVTTSNGESDGGGTAPSEPAQVLPRTVGTQNLIKYDDLLGENGSTPSFNRNQNRIFMAEQGRYIKVLDITSPGIYSVRADTISNGIAPSDPYAERMRPRAVAPDDTFVAEGALIQSGEIAQVEVTEQMLTDHPDLALRLYVHDTDPAPTHVYLEKLMLVKGYHVAEWESGDIRYIEGNLSPTTVPHSAGLTTSTKLPLSLTANSESYDASTQVLTMSKGVWMLTVSYGLSGVASGELAIDIKVDGTAVQRLAGQASDMAVSGVVVVNLEHGQTLQLTATQNSGADAPGRAVSDNLSRFTAKRLT